MAKARVLLYDIETSPNIAYIWGKYEQNALGSFIKERKMISVAWKWLGEKTVHVAALPMFRGYKKDSDDNSLLVKKFHEVISEADIVIGHNVKEFDDKMINTDFIRLGLLPPTPHKSIDTRQVARTYFRFNSNKLDDLGEFLGLGRKVKHSGFSLWKGCLMGDRESWRTMIKYNKQDVVLLERVYLRLRPWINNHPDLSDYDRTRGCPACLSEKRVSRGWAFTRTGKKQRYRCLDCGKWYTGVFVRDYKP